MLRLVDMSPNLVRMLRPVDMSPNLVRMLRPVDMSTKFVSMLRPVDISQYCQVLNPCRFESQNIQCTLAPKHTFPPFCCNARQCDQFYCSYAPSASISFTKFPLRTLHPFERQCKLFHLTICAGGQYCDILTSKGIYQFQCCRQ